MVALIKRGVQDQKEIYSAPFQRRNLKWDALFLVGTAGLIAGDKHIAGAIRRGNRNVSQSISDVGLYSTLATTGVLYLDGIFGKNQHAREAGFRSEGLAICEHGKARFPTTTVASRIDISG